ncbi:MAG: thiamine-phosphate kinase, partial [Candidatus Bipolaricaulota bacterium]
MNEQEALEWLAERMPVGDDCYVLDRVDEDLLLTTDMLHRSADFPPGTTDFTIGWRSVAVSLSDLAGMGGVPLALLIAYGAPNFERESLEEFLDGADEVCSLAGGRIVGGDLDRHQELTVTTTGVGRAKSPVMRSGAEIGDLVVVTGDLG